MPWKVTSQYEVDKERKEIGARKMLLFVVYFKVILNGKSKSNSCLNVVR